MILAITVFLITYVVIATEKFPRQIVALFGAVILVLLNVFDLKEAFGFVDWETIGLLFGMFILIELLKASGFFGWLAATVAERLHFHPTYIFLAFPLMAGLLSAFMDSITVMLFLTALTIRIAKVINIDPVPLIVAEVCAANTGGTATLVGNPPNVLLGTLLGFDFNQFLIHSAPIALPALLVVVGVSYLMNRKMLRAAHAELKLAQKIEDDPGLHITHPRLLQLGLVGFGVALVLLVGHNALSSILSVHISVAVAALLPAFIVVIVGGKETRQFPAKVDMDSLLFFIGLFMLVGALDKTGVIKLLATGVANFASGNAVLLLMVLHWGSGIASGVVDNVPMALAMAFLMKNLAAMPGSPALSIMLWSLALGLNIGGNMTPVGASANVVAYSYMERNHIHVGWGRWIKLAVPPAVCAMLLCSVLLIVKYVIGWY